MEVYSNNVQNRGFSESDKERIPIRFPKAVSVEKNPENVGTNVTLLITHDDMDYGVDKNGHKRENNVLNTFDVTILNGQTTLPFKKGEKVSLGKFIPEKSYVIGFDVLLRFADIKKAGGVNAAH